MGMATLPVDLRNPGQVFACLGLLEAAEVLCGGAFGRFSWQDGPEHFYLSAAGEANPVETVLAFLAAATVEEFYPVGYADHPKNREVGVATWTFPTREGDKMPIRLTSGGQQVDLSHWTDGARADSFKLYSGNRSAAGIATAMLGLIQALWQEQQAGMIATPLDVLCPMAGSFNFDPRGAWTSLDAGYSPNEHKVKGNNVHASPVVEMLAAWGLQHACPDQYKTRQVRYGVWGAALPPLLARAALAGGNSPFPLRKFEFSLLLSGKNKVVCFAQEDETQ